MLELYIGSKNYSSWSMRAWVLLRQAGIDFEEVLVPFDSFERDSSFKRQICAISPVGKVPVLRDGSLVVWDSLAIAEYVAEYVAKDAAKDAHSHGAGRDPEKSLWPRDPQSRARARSACAEMHSGFTALRQYCPMNIEAHLPQVGAQLWSEHESLRADVQRLSELWLDLLAGHEQELLFGPFSIADAFFAPVCMRLWTYALPVPELCGSYAERVRALPGVRAWVQGALAEKNFLPFEEPYRSAPGGAWAGAAPKERS